MRVSVTAEAIVLLKEVDIVLAAEEICGRHSRDSGADYRDTFTLE